MFRVVDRVPEPVVFRLFETAPKETVPFVAVGNPVPVTVVAVYVWLPATAEAIERLSLGAAATAVETVLVTGADGFAAIACDPPASRATKLSGRATPSVAF
jgi:hypothetical protein